MIYVGDLIVGDVGRGDYENVACFDDHKKLDTVLICLYFVFGEIVSIAKIGMNGRDGFTSQSWAASTLPVLSPITGKYSNIVSIVSIASFVICNR